MRTGCFLAFEGIDGSGKSTQLRLLHQRLEALGIEHTVTREPTDSAIGSLIRQVLRGEVRRDNRTVAALFAADRLDHLLDEQTGLAAQVAAGRPVLTDRYYFSSYAYHSVDMPMEWVIQANALSAAILRPTVTIFIDLPPEKALDRIRQNRAQIELYETRERLTQVRENYYRSFRLLGKEERVLVFDGDQTPEALAEEVWSVTRGFFRDPGTEYLFV